jgi:DNA-binding response OmpR family regulator
LNEQKSVLLVGNDRIILDLNKRVLEREGYRVLTALNLEEARALIDGAPTGVAVLDPDKPDASVLSFCHEVRAGTGVPVIFLTTSAGEEYERAAYEAGVDDCIIKPYQMDRLTESVDALINSIQLEYPEAKCTDFSDRQLIKGG